MTRDAWAALSLSLALAAACTGEDPAFILAGPNDGGQATNDAQSSGPGGDDGGADSPEDGGADGGTACIKRDSTPCNCGSATSCCTLDDGGALCQPRGNEDVGLGCTTTNTITCVGDCAGGQACCFHGEVTVGETCPLRLTRYDSQCVSYNAGDPENACTDTTNGVRHHVLCQVTADCTRHDAGTCQSAMMDGVGRIMGVCVP
ncbi:MAG TPA: hypothetical protein VM580_32535 [Labilithrix sp.]|nr:hypothetical protein [Labilithrix sp.]